MPPTSGNAGILGAVMSGTSAGMWKVQALPNPAVSCAGARARASRAGRPIISSLSNRTRTGAGGFEPTILLNSIVFLAPFKPITPAISTGDDTCRPLVHGEAAVGAHPTFGGGTVIMRRHSARCTHACNRGGTNGAQQTL
jgi:hypothetical protein